MRLLSLLLLLCSCTHTVPRAEVDHYAGEITLKIPKAHRPFARLPVVMRVTRDPEMGMIMEELVMPARDAKAAAREIVSNYRATIKEGLFQVRDNLHSFRGVVQFTSGRAWHWDKWSLHIIMKDGARVRGNGQVTDNGFEVLKTVYSAKGSPLFIQREVLRPIDHNEYKTRRRQIVRRELKYIKN